MRDELNALRTAPLEGALAGTPELEADEGEAP
jgi:hypothetical protein